MPKSNINAPDNKIQITCYGEVLWDIFPQATKIGGAPLNVAYHLNKMGVTSRMISRVGSDDLGDQLIRQINDWGINSTNIQQDPAQPTGTVIATIDEENEASYDIKFPSAWDYIQHEDSHQDLISESAALVFGSLITRNEMSYKTLMQLVDYSNYNVFDVNLRPPFYSEKILVELLEKAQLVKMNKAELKLILSIFNKEYEAEADSLQFVMDRFRIAEVVLTKGSKGAVYSSVQGLFHSVPAFPIQIKDTVGSGDSFLAGFLSQSLKGSSPVESLQHAAALGAFITMHEGACPPYTAEEFDKFKASVNIT